MKILHLDCGREMRGGQWQAVRLHQGLLERGHESVLLAPKHSPLLSKGALPLQLLRLPVLMRNFDLVHAHDARSHTLCALLGRIPLVVSRRVAFPVRESASSEWKYRQPALFLAVSRYVRRQLIRAGVEERRIEVVHDGVPVPEKPARGEEILVFEKGFKVAGAAARRAGVFLNPVTRLESQIPNAKALVYISESEGLGSGILLGMAYGVTVIGSNVGGIPELITDGVNGLLTSNHEESLAGAFSRINPALGAAARETVKSRFTVEHMVQATLDAYTKVLAGG